MGQILFAALVLTAAAVGPATAQTETSAWTEVTANQADVKLLTTRARGVASAPEFKWKLAQTPHFVVHFENGIFAAKVGRLAEFFYDYIKQDLGGTKDLADGRSHIFIFRNAADWKQFQTRYGAGSEEWSFSFVEGPAMFLQQAADIGSSADVLGHEMTHLVIHRFIPERLPLWLNEGVAEWYGEFAYAAYKGVKKSKRSVFRALPASTRIDSILHATEYPATIKDVRQFYELSKYMVGFLQLEKPGAFAPFLRAVGDGKPVSEALRAQYQFPDEAALEKEFWKFAR